MREEGTTHGTLKDSTIFKSGKYIMQVFPFWQCYPLVSEPQLVVGSHHYSSELKQIHNLPNDDKQNYPFCRLNHWLKSFDSSGLETTIKIHKCTQN